MICFACRRRLLAASVHRVRAPPRLSQWQTRAPLSSASAGSSASAPATDDYVPSIDATGLEDTNQRPVQVPARQYDGASESRFSGMHRRRVARRQGDSSKENSLEIFEKVVRQQTDQDNATAKPPTSSKPPATMDFYNDLARLRPMMQTESIETCLEFFIDKIWATCPYEGRNRLLKQRGTYLMRRVVEAKMKDFDNERLPSIARCTQIFHELDTLSSEKWADSIMGLILNVTSESRTKQGNSSAEAHDKLMARKGALLNDLVDSWAVFHRHCLTPNKSAFRFPRIDEKRLQQYAMRGEIFKAMRMIFPQFKDNAFKELPAVAIASFVVLSDPLHTNFDIQQKAGPLLQPLGKILTAIPIWKAGLQGIFRGYPEVLVYVLKRWDAVVSQLRQTGGFESKSSTERKPASKQRAGPASSVIHNRVTGALKMGDVEAIEAAWTRFWGIEVRPEDERAAQLQGNQELFHFFIMAFTALHRPQRSVDVWDSMTRIGIKPTLKTWTSLIEGCRRSKNAVGIENVWKKLLATGEVLDDGVWSARIVGLVDCREPEAGLRALDEMLRLSKFNPEHHAVAKLTRKITSINAAVSALIRLNAMSAAMKVLTWASENGIEPDVYTYNTLLRPMVQQGSVELVDGLLKMMKTQGVQPDVATFTVLLDGLIGDTKGASPAEQVKMVTGLFSEMEAAGVRANMETFARMIHLLLCEPGANATAAVGAIRAYMSEKGLHTSPYIYTILLDYHFSQDPPDLAAVDELIDEGGFKMEDGRLRWRVLDHGRRGLDRVFWERVIKGYATAGQVDRAYDIFEQTNNLGSALTLDTLEILLRGLVMARRVDEARAMVDLVLSHRQTSNVYGTANAGVNAAGEGQKLLGRFWRHAFWAFAVDCGLLSPARLRQLEMGARAAAPEEQRVY
ncbi:hypothetical protein VPNG_09470 [Cytospora leucostoma]|uniref:Pentacotripeptide-repeat region of PRORP domain-containing protein n=1 Tax=Cytospora leucostoma TaxID=1230097 RepID=A0A423VVL1_9PEZI|nr:hypothetical protein VPNG_09470 [Cytospora leucostoma]